MRWCPGIGAGTEKLVHIPNSNWRCSTVAFSFHSFSQSGGKRIERK
ncbi:MAG: hypothetical protein QM296_04190 [Bacillota bacterium]|nr:hypothetical protein [Bacillota bacterium]